MRSLKDLLGFRNDMFRCLLVSVLCEFNFCVYGRVHTFMFPSFMCASSLCKQLYSPQQLNEQVNGVSNSCMFLVTNSQCVLCERVCARVNNPCAVQSQDKNSSIV